ncbi:hypothetical protein [Bradyrhizobium sp. USDA 4473]
MRDIGGSLRSSYMAISSPPFSPRPLKSASPSSELAIVVSPAPAANDAAMASARPGIATAYTTYRSLPFLATPIETIHPAAIVVFIRYSDKRALYAFICEQPAPNYGGYIRAAAKTVELSIARMTLGAANSRAKHLALQLDQKFSREAPVAISALAFAP